MVGVIIGIVLVKKRPEHTNYLFGDNAEIAGKPLNVWERNEQGDCLCLDHKGSNLVDIDNRDVAAYVAMPETSVLADLLKAISKQGVKP